jgi:tetratricopeptide (TPR) repeat protein
MTDFSEETSYVISVEAFDKGLLPPHARTPGTDAFREEVSKLIQKDFADFAGWVQIVVGNETIQVRWRHDPTRPSPMQVVLEKLKRGEYPDAIRLLEMLRQQQPENFDVLYNLGMALSDMGALDTAETHLRHALRVTPGEVRAMIALGVVLGRQRRIDEAIEVLRQAVEREPGNPWALRNLGACLLKVGQIAEAETLLGQAVELNPRDQQSVFAHAQALHAKGDVKAADAGYAKTISLDEQSPVAEAARQERTRLAEDSFRKALPMGVRPDAVMYCLGALRKFDKMPLEEVKRIGFEIAVLGQRGLDTNNPDQKYTLKSLPGTFSGLHLVCLMYVAFKQIATEQSIGFDLSKEYEVARSLFPGDQGRLA